MKYPTILKSEFTAQPVVDYTNRELFMCINVLIENCEKPDNTCGEDEKREAYRKMYKMGLTLDWFDGFRDPTLMKGEIRYWTLLTLKAVARRVDYWARKIRIRDNKKALKIAEEKAGCKCRHVSFNEELIEEDIIVSRDLKEAMEIGLEWTTKRLPRERVFRRLGERPANARKGNPNHKEKLDTFRDVFFRSKEDDLVGDYTNTELVLCIDELRWGCLKPDAGCSCHISPPCSACTDPYRPMLEMADDIGKVNEYISPASIKGEIRISIVRTWRLILWRADYWLRKIRVLDHEKALKIAEKETGCKCRHVAPNEKLLREDILVSRDLENAVEVGCETNNKLPRDRVFRRLEGNPAD